MNKIYALLAAFLLAGSAFAAVNINTATQSELEALPEVGPARAKAIIDYRAKNGPFKTNEDLIKVEGIGDKNFVGMKDKISTSGPTKIDWKTEAKKDAPKADAGKMAAPAAAAGTAAAPKADAGKMAAPAAAAPAAAPAAAAPKAADKPMTKDEKAAADKAKKEADKKAKADEKAKKAADKKAKADEAKAKKEADAKAKKDAAKAKEAPAKDAAKKDAPKADAPKADAKKDDTPKKP